MTDIIAALSHLTAEVARLREAGLLARSVLAGALSAGWNISGPVYEDVDKAFWALDAALEATDDTD